MTKKIPNASAPLTPTFIQVITCLIVEERFYKQLRREIFLWQSYLFSQKPSHCCMLVTKYMNQ